MKATMATKPPKCIIRQTRPQATKAMPAVMNQPPITLTTPVMRNTAVSRFQALSARLEPMATMKVT